MTYSDEVYPNQPLQEVVFELRFPGEVRIECERHLFWEKIRDDYSEISVPRPVPDQAMALMPYRFRKSDRSMSVLVCMRSLAVSAKIYPGYKEFSKEVLRIYEIFGSTFNLKKLNRIGWRYINIIPFIRENGSIPLTRFLNLGFKVPKSVPEKFKNLDFVFESEHEGCSVITRLQSIEKLSGHDNAQEALLLDFDYGKVPTIEQELNFSDVPKYLNEAHQKTRQLFEDFITEEYRQYLRGDVI
ncbi:MAG TPA: TIGR04255 family protein [Ignavibacteria bacterium]|nr:TIGR04255 family protein [Ignavibacteria bacterium]